MSVLERVDCSTSSNGPELKQPVYIHRTSCGWPRGVAQLLSVPEIAPKSPILCEQRPIQVRYGFRAVTRYGIMWTKRNTIALDTAVVPVFQLNLAKAARTLRRRMVVLYLKIFPIYIAERLSETFFFKSYKRNKGRCKESTIIGHRKNLSPRWDSNPRPSVF